MVVEVEKSIGIAATLFAFLGGAIAFTLADIVAEKKGGGAGILLGMGLDSIPESLAIGAAIASGPYFALSLLIGIQNISEGITSYKEMMTGKTAFSDNPKKVLASAAIISALPVCNLGFSRAFLPDWNERGYCIYTCIVRGRYFLYVVL